MWEHSIEQVKSKVCVSFVKFSFVNPSFLFSILPMAYFQMELGDHLLPCFSKSPSGIPYSDVNLASRIPHSPRWSPDSSTSEVTTVQLEFRDLSRSTKLPIFEVFSSQYAQLHTSYLIILNCVITCFWASLITLFRSCYHLIRRWSFIYRLPGFFPVSSVSGRWKQHSSF